jgi:hypothetical protein
MTAQSDKLIEKLQKVAQAVEQEKPELHFFGLVHRNDTPDRWDLLVSSDQLVPWSFAALNYIAGHLQKILTTEERVRIAQIVALPRNHPLLKDLNEQDQILPGGPGGLHPMDQPDQAIVIWPHIKKLRAHSAI